SSQGGLSLVQSASQVWSSGERVAGMGGMEVQMMILLGGIFGGAVLHSMNLPTIGMLSIYFGAQTGLGLYMKILLSDLPIAAELNIRGVPAPFLITALQQLLTFVALVVVLLALLPTRWAYKPRQLQDAKEVGCVLIISVAFAANIGLNNLSLSLLPVSANMIIRSCIPLITWILQQLVGCCGLGGFNSSWGLAEFALLLSGHVFLKDRNHKAHFYRLCSVMASIAVRIAFLSGEEHRITVPVLATTHDLRSIAEMKMQRSLGKLISARGAVMLASRTLVQEGVEDGDVITAIFQDVAVAAASNAFAAIRSDGSVVAWGDPQGGGDCSAVQKQLQHVQSIQAAWGAFAALRTDGSVVTWGDRDGGGDSSLVQSQLCNVSQIQSTGLAFAAIKEDGGVVVWGSRDGGGDCRAVRDHLYSVRQIQSNSMAFAALRADGSVVSWGAQLGYGSHSSAVLDELQEGVLNIYSLSIYSHDFAGFAAIKSGGRIVFWGDPLLNGLVHSGLDDIAHLQVAGGRWAAASQDGHLALSLRSIRGDRCLRVPECAGSLVRCNNYLAVLQKDGTVQFWGRIAPTWLRNELSNVVRLRMAWERGAAIRSDGSVVVWEFTGTGAKPGASALVRSQLTDVKDIHANPFAFAALRRDGSVVTWGNGLYGGNSAAVQRQLKDVVSIQAGGFAFAATRRDGSVVSWGLPAGGGDSSLVQEQLGHRIVDKKRATMSREAAKIKAVPHTRTKSRVLKKPSKKSAK
ncbi:USP, partial [Symbiodinium sp. CCMP2456]